MNILSALYKKITIIAISLWLIAGCTVNFDSSKPADRAPRIWPDYTDVTIPSNIAPLNFVIKEEGIRFHVEIFGNNGEKILITSKSPKISIPLKKWKELLNKNIDHDITVQIFVKAKDWIKFKPIINHVAPEPIDPYLVYRKLKPAYHRSARLSLHQRDLESFRVTRLLTNDSLDRGSGCMNCHTFLNNKTNQMSLHIRGAYAGTMLLKDGSIEKVDTRTQRNNKPGAFASWHPSGKLLAYSFNNVRQLCHTAQIEVREAFDVDSDIFLYFIKDKTALSPPLLRQPDRLETFPAWAPDGKRLYFSSAKKLWDDLGENEEHIVDYVEKVKYDIMSLEYDPATGEWGKLDTLLSSDSTGKSMIEPRVSPDGKFLVFCMTPHSWMSSYAAVSDLYIIDLATGLHKKLECSAHGSESWHSWSSNSRWLAFSSKRYDGQILRTYFAYVDETGIARKAFVLPQKAPDHYESSIWMFHLPELISEPVPFSEKELLNAVRSTKMQESEAVTGATLKASTGPMH